MNVLAKPIRFFDDLVVLACDGNCDKAWGNNGRPKVSLSDDPDDYYFVPDGELGKAPIDPGTYEGGDGKPRSRVHGDRQNKWCARECERSVLHKIGVIKLPDFSQRVYNKESTQ